MTNTSQIHSLRGNNSAEPPFHLQDWGLISVEGPDATDFLQNQLTNSVLGLHPTPLDKQAYSYSSARLVGYCNPKGRLLASAWLALFETGDEAESRYLLFISKDIAASTAKRLSMYVLRSKVKVLDLSSQWIVSGLYGSDKEIADFKLKASSFGLRLPNVLVGDQSVARLLIASPATETIEEIESTEKLIKWNNLEVLSAIPRIVLATQEQFVPQMINLESVGGVDFKKGCYPGQEIVARSQYRGVIKRRLHLAHVLRESQHINLFAPGTELYHSQDFSQPAGMVVLSSIRSDSPNYIDMQIECKLEALLDGEIYLGGDKGPVLKIDVLPYSLLEI